MAAVLILCLLAAAVSAGCGRKAALRQGGSASARSAQVSGGAQASGAMQAASASAGAAVSGGKDSGIQSAAQDIARMLESIKKDAASITTADSSPDGTDSTIDEINKALSGSEDDIAGLTD